MKKTILILMLLVFVNSVFAQETCEYNGIKTEFSYPYQEPGKKAEYKDEKFVRMVDSKVVKNLEQLKGLICLESADFYNQGISGDLEKLKGLISLKVLSLHTNPNVQGDVCAFSKATKLKSLKLAFDEKVYGDISCLKDLNLDTFAMTYSKISGDLSDLSHMTNLKALYLSGTNIAGNISSLSGLTNLEELTLSDSEMDGSKFYGDLASLDNLKKLRRVALYNMGATNCEHFHEVHPNIEGGCSDKSKSTVTNTNVESEKIIGKEARMPMDAPKDDGPKSSDGPPEECIVNKQFIGEDKCRALMDKKHAKGSSGAPPPKECIVNGKFIGDDKCMALVDKTSSTKTSSVQQEKTEPRGAVNKAVTKKGLMQKVINWLVSLFK
ncbi:hypothetical protein HYX01_01245 [Candidatus Woesearchaeota archaeon]|nr:hypothetical protein [Candidatus Woesearchaeota archaeon]